MGLIGFSGGKILSQAALCALLASAAAGQRIPDPLAAVGWLGRSAGPVAGKASCSGVLIAADLVLTAAHCLIDADTGQPHNPTKVTFAAGMAQGVAVVTRHGHAMYLPTSPLQPSVPEAEALAVLQLDQPVPPTAVTPMPIADAPLALGMPTTTIGYPRTAPDTPTRQDSCDVILSEPPAVGLSCDAVSGFSGGAVLSQTDGLWHLAAIMVAQALKTPGVGAIAVTVSPDLLAQVPAE